MEAEEMVEVFLEYIAEMANRGDDKAHELVLLYENSPLNFCGHCMGGTDENVIHCPVCG